MSTQAFHDTVSTPASVMVSKASDVLGVELAMSALGVGDRRTLMRWRSGAPIRAVRMRMRLQAVFLIISELEQSLTPAQIPAWFTTPNPAFGYRTALDMLIEESLETVVPTILETVSR